MDSQNNRFETLKDIFKDVKNILEKINNYGFFQRLFAWKLLKKDSTKLDSKLEDVQDIISDLREKLNRLDDLNDLKDKIAKKDDDLKDLREKNTKFESTIGVEKQKLVDAQNKYHIMITKHEDKEMVCKYRRYGLLNCSYTGSFTIRGVEPSSLVERWVDLDANYARMVDLRRIIRYYENDKKRNIEDFKDKFQEYSGY